MSLNFYSSLEGNLFKHFHQLWVFLCIWGDRFHVLRHFGVVFFFSFSSFERTGCRKLAVWTMFCSWWTSTWFTSWSCLFSIVLILSFMWYTFVSSVPIIIIVVRINVCIFRISFPSHVSGLPIFSLNVDHNLLLFYFLNFLQFCKLFITFISFHVHDRLFIFIFVIFDCVVGRILIKSSFSTSSLIINWKYSYWIIVMESYFLNNFLSFFNKLLLWHNIRKIRTLFFCVTEVLLFGRAIINIIIVFKIDNWNTILTVSRMVRLLCRELRVFNVLILFHQLWVLNFQLS